MTGDELNPNEPLSAAVAALRRGPDVAPGLVDRTRGLARRRQSTRRAVGSLGGVAALALAFLVITPRNAPAGQVTFALVAPASAGVSLVGDFNDWDRDRVRLQSVGKGEWRVTLKLPPGRYRYSYVTDEGTWLADPGAPPAFDEFGTPTSVVTIPGGS